MQLHKCLLQLVVVTILTACTTKTIKEQPAGPSGDFRYVPLADFKYEPATIAPGTEVEIMADLGGDPNHGDTVFYYQFMVRNKATNDTIRILCPEITVDETAGIDNKTTTTPLLFNFSKGITTAFYEAIDSSKSLLLNGENLSKMTAGSDTIDISHLLDPGNAKKFVVLDRNASAKENSMFKTAIGILNFKKIPW